MFNIHFFIERWKWNPDFELYVSNKGHFRNRDKKDVPIQIDKNGYCSVYCGGTTHRHLLAHRVVMHTWRPTPNAEFLTVDHRDHNKRNNAVDNLEWVTKEENIRRAKADELKVAIKGNLLTTKYDFYLRLNESTLISVENFANLFFGVYGKNSYIPNTHKCCDSIEIFCEAVAEKAKSVKIGDKFFGFHLEVIPNKEEK